MSGGVTQLLAVGAQDVYLTNDPEVSFFRSNYKRYTHFSQSVERQTIQTNPNPGSMSTVRIERKGDLLGYTYLTATSTATTLITNIDWSQAIDKIELYIGGQLIDTQDSTFNYLIAPVTMSETYNKRFHGTTATYTTANNTFYPLKFFFCSDFQSTIPLIGIPFSDIELRIYWGSTMTNTYQYDIWSDFMYLDGPERDYFQNSSGPLDVLMWQVQRQLIPTSSTAELSFNQPIKFLAANVLAYTSGTQQLKTQINGTDISIFKGLPHYVDVPQYYHTHYGINNPGAVGGAAQPPNVLIIPYCLDTTKLQPTGTVNFSRIDSFRIVSPIALGGGIFPAGSYMYGVNYNVLRVMNGMASLLYAN